MNMKKLFCAFFIVILAIPSIAFAFDEMTRYDFGNGDYYIWIPNDFLVVHENSTEEELLSNEMYAENGAKEFLDSFGVALFASWQNSQKGLLINIYENIFDEDIRIEDRFAAEALIESWTPLLERANRYILFTDPIIGEYEAFGKIASMSHDEQGTVYYVDYVLLFNGNIVTLTFSSENGQFNIEEGHILDSIADKTGSNWGTFEIG